MKIYCAYCNCKIHDDVYMFTDNYLIAKYFDNNKSNRFCSRDCACEALMLEQVEREDLPLDKDEEAEGEQ